MEITWSIIDGSERPDILKPLGLQCHNGSYENEDYNKKTYDIRVRYSYQNSSRYILLNQEQFNQLLKVKTFFKTEQQLQLWLKTIIRKEKLEKINNKW